MRITELAIKNHQFTIVAVIMLVLLGIVSLFTMPYSEDPQVSNAGTSVIVIYPGASPKDMEQLVVDTIEEAINELDDIKMLSSGMQDSLASIAVEFESGSDPDKKFSDVTEKVNSIRSLLPDGVTSVDLWKWSVSDTNILQMAIVSETSAYKELEEYAERLKKNIEKVKGIRESETWGYPEQEVHVTLNLDKMSRMGIPLNQVFGIIQSNNVNIPGGDIDIGNMSFNVRTSGSFRSLEDLRDTVIHSYMGKIVQLKDIAHVGMNYKDEEHLARYDGTRAVFVTATQKEDTNIFSIFSDLRKVISKFEEELPESMKIYYAFDQSKSVRHRIWEFTKNLIGGIILVGVVVFLSLSFRSSIIVMLAIPISIAIGIGFVDLTGYGIQQMTIAGLVIALGILVDNAIVVVENTTRFMKLGYDRLEAAIKATEQISWAVISATATTILAFVPIIMMQDITGDFIRSMPTTVVYTLTASLFLALTFTPYLASRFLKTEDEESDKSESGFTHIIKWLPSKIQNAQDYFITGPYRRILNFSLNRNKLIVILSVVVFLISLGLSLFVGISFFPKAEKSQFVINVTAPKGTSLYKTDEVARYIESVLATKEEISHYVTNVGRGNPRIYYNIISRNRDKAHAQFYVDLKEYDRLILSRLINELREEFDNYPEARIDVKELEQGPPVEAPIAIRVVGERLDVLRDVSRDVEKIITEEAGTVNVDNPLTTTRMDLHVNINHQKSAALGLQLLDIDRTVRTCVAGMPISKYRDPEGEEFDITIKIPTDGDFSVEDFDKIYLTSVIGTQIPLKQVASFKFSESAQEITHDDMDRSVTVTADVLEEYSTAEVTNKIVEKLDSYKWPIGTRYEVGGEAESREQSFGGMGKAIIIAMIGIYAVLILQFKSFIQPAVVFAAIPLAVIGSILALLTTGYTFSFTAFIGLTSLVGIVVNNAIILVEYTNQLRDAGSDLVEALKKAGETRFRPIIFTTATTIGGLLPLTLAGGSLWAPMGWTIIGGLLVSTVLTLVIVPVLYKTFESKSRDNQGNISKEKALI
ncbi:MMPL family transporter [Candidatus Poribacteria bacterium]|nr:MMPL family transporter [Candidatus Poribacteria bacterium]